MTWYSGVKAACLPSLQKIVVSFAAIQKHEKTRRKAAVSSAEDIFKPISAGNVSEADLSDDEANLPADVTDTVGVQKLYTAQYLCERKKYF